MTTNLLAVITVCMMTNVIEFHPKDLWVPPSGDNPFLLIYRQGDYKWQPYIEGHFTENPSVKYEITEVWRVKTLSLDWEGEKVTSERRTCLSTNVQLFMLEKLEPRWMLMLTNGTRTDPRASVGWINSAVTNMILENTLYATNITWPSLLQTNWTISLTNITK